jgi:hypothetical protein
MTAMPEGRSSLQTHGPAYLCLAALLLISVTHWTRDAFDHIDVVRHASEYIRDPFEFGDDPNGDATSLQPEAEHPTPNSPIGETVRSRRQRQVLECCGRVLGATAIGSACGVTQDEIVTRSAAVFSSFLNGGGARCYSPPVAYMYRVWRKPLSAYVNYLWVAEDYVQPHAREFVLPTASLTLVIDLDVEKADAILICGARSEPLILGTAKPLRLMAAVFKPGGRFPFAECPAGELQSLQVPLSAFWPSETADLRDHLCEAPTNRERFRVLERFLMQRLRASPALRGQAAENRGLRVLQVR